MSRKGEEISDDFIGYNDNNYIFYQEKAAVISLTSPEYKTIRGIKVGGSMKEVKELYRETE